MSDHEVEAEAPQSGRRSQRKAAANAQHVMDRALGKKQNVKAASPSPSEAAAAVATSPTIMPPKKATKKQKATKAKQKLYCICRTSDDSRPMIACDDCKEWFHLDCINMTEADADNIDKFYCAACEHNDKTKDSADKYVKREKSERPQQSAKSKSASASPSPPPPRQKRKASPLESNDSDYDQEESDYEDERKMDVDQEEGDADEPQEEPEEDYADRPAKKRRSERAKPVKRAVKKTSPAADTDSHIPQDSTRQRIVSAFAAILKPFFVEQNPDNADAETDAKATAIEQAIFEATGSDVGQQYKDKFRNLSFNLKDKGNVSLAKRIVSDALTPTEFATATSEELANPELRTMAEEVRKQSLTGSVLKQVRGPIIRKTHKGEEMVEATVETGAIDNDAKKEAEQSRRDEEDERAEILRRRDSSAMDGQPPTPNSASFPSRARLSGGFDKSPSVEHSPGVPPSPTFPHERSNSAAQSDLDNILSSLRVKKTDPASKISDGASKSPTIDTVKAAKVDLTSVWNHSKSPIVEQTPDSDGESKSPVANGEQRATSVAHSRNVIWNGRVHMPAEGHFQADGIQVGGRKRETVREWEAILPATMNVDGRIPIERVSTYLTQMHNTATKELVAVLIKRQPDTEGSANNDGFEHLFKYFHEKERYGVVRTTYEVTKDIYLIPLTPDDSLPEYLDYIEDFHVPEADRKEDLFLLVLVYNMTQSPKATHDRRDRPSAMFIPKDQQKRGQMRPPPRAEPVNAAPPANIDFKLLESVLGMDPSILANLQQQQAPSQSHSHRHAQPPTGPRGPAIHPDRAMHMQGDRRGPSGPGPQGPGGPPRYDDRGPPRGYPPRGYDDRYNDRGPPDFDRDRRDGPGPPRDRDGRGRGPPRR